MALHFLNGAKFLAASGGTGSFVDSGTPVVGYANPPTAGAISTDNLRYRAESDDLTQWEIGVGVATVTAGIITLTRVAVLLSSTGAKVSFTNPPKVGITFLASDLVHPTQSDTAAPYLWSTSTAANPGVGNIGVNSATIASATKLNISLDMDPAIASNVLSTWFSAQMSNAYSDGAILCLGNRPAVLSPGIGPGLLAVYKITNPQTVSAGYLQFDCVNILNPGLSNGNLLWAWVLPLTKSKVPTGGAAGTILTKTTTTDYDSAWSTAAAVRTLLGVREVLTAARTYYVDGSAGNDANDGLSNTSGHQLLTVAAAMTKAAALDCSTFQLTVQINAGTYTAQIVLPKMIGSVQPILTGVGATTIISTTTTTIVGVGIFWIVQNMKVTTTAGFVLSFSGGSIVTVSAVEWGAGALGHCFASTYSFVTVTGACTISGGAQFFGLVNSATLSFSVATFTLTGTPAFSGAFMLANRLGLVLTTAGNFSFTGTATGSRYLSQENSCIDTTAAGANHFPGNAVGTVNTGGLYV